jgi:hypothetical protein
MNEKSILEQALLQVKTLEEAVKTNAKGILASTMKQELNDLLKESLEEEDDVYEQAPKKGKKDVPDEGDEDLDNEEMDDEELDMDDEDSEMDDEDSEMDDEELDMDDEDSEMDDEELDMDDEDSDFDSLNMGNDQPDMGGFDSEDNEVFNATDASPSEVLRIFKAMKPEDGFIVKKDDGQIEFKDGDNEYIIKLDESEMDEYPMDEEDEFFGDEYSSMDEEDEFFGDEYTMDEEDEFFSDEDDDSLFGPQSMSVDEENDFDDAIKSHMNNDDEVVYEIDLDGNDDDMMSPEGDVGEAARTKWNIHGDKGGSNRAGIKSKKLFASGAINEEVTKLKKQNTEYRKALILFKDKLNEVAVFNANLAYATRLFTEHSTTKKEKINILKKFDSVSTLKESKNLYNNLKNDLDTKKPVSESVVEKLRTSPSTSSSTQVLSEAKAYENPQFRRMKDLMSKLK